MTVLRSGLWPVLWSAAIFAGTACLPDARSLAESETPLLTEPMTEVACDLSGCDVRIVAEFDGGQIRSGPLPFRAVNAEIDPIPGIAAFGHVLPDRPARPLMAWAVGGEENSIGVAVDIVATGKGGPAILVYQMAGFEHVKRAHTVLTVRGAGLVAILERVEGPGPDFISMAPIEGGIGMMRVAQDGAVTAETLLWRRGILGPELAAFR